MTKQRDKDNKPDLRILIRNFLIELVLYGILVVGYFLVALQFLNDFLTNMFHNNLIVYAFLALLLIVVQGVLLDGVTSFLLNRINLDRLD